jgi:hypothetical protein
VHLGHRVAVVVLAREERLQLEARHPGLEIVEGLLELLGQPLLGRSAGLGLVYQLVEHAGLVEAGGQLLEPGQVVGHPPELGGDPATPVPVVPEVRAGGLGLQLVAAVAERLDVEVAIGLVDPAAQPLELGGAVTTLAGPGGLRRRHGRA